MTYNIRYFNSIYTGQKFVFNDYVYVKYTPTTAMLLSLIGQKGYCTGWGRHFIFDGTELIVMAV